ncbi:protein phosphatase 1 regulatory subunit 26 [Lepus europaeus]|uniref:protein phosphatase 1 regulatory subunit 26 n=1 Tax=Lepus europaeus TaxID=9983 RepID=UPI002B4A014C|nr:protein phosphatase 1 regulatory subunit 26 [Lepus europaeus]
MFLMNAPPVAALRSKWEAFRFPRCFSEPEAAVARASVSARVHMVISSLQRGVSHEPAAPRSHRAERGPLVRPPARHGQQPLLAACGLEPAAPDSDSDDSVDRDIEEAIQEYLRARGGAAQHAGAGRCKPEPAPVAAPAAPCPDPGGEDRGSASPASVSSDDSFEQSIRAEIEQFLRQKRQQETHRGEGPADRSPDPGESPARSTSRPCRELAGRAAPPARLDPAGASREFIFRKAPRWAKANGQPRGLRAEAAQQRGGAGRRPPRAQATAPAREASDSSSDDGIEEAIQLYQLEKTRREAGGGPPTDGGSSAARPGLPEAHRRTPSKKKQGSMKAADPGPPTKLPRAGKAAVPPGDSAGRPCCRADASAELLCAEAILDISKAILPVPGEGSGTRPPASLLLRPPDVPSHADGGDGSSVDSDDSIEQEIRAFLALKAQAGSLLARAEGGPQPTQGPHSQPGDPKTPLPRPPELPLSCRRKRRGCGSSLRPSAPKKTREPRDGGQGASLGPGRAQPGQDLPGLGLAGGELPREQEASGQPAACRAARLSDTQASPGPGRAEEARSAKEKESSQDKSSSLDSDEDLDTAIKDLLRSKRKLRRRGRDPRATGRKKVRFSTPETRLSDRLGGLPRGCGEQSPQVLKSCLSPCRRKPPSTCTRPEAALAGESAAPVSRPRGRASSRGSPSSGEAAARDQPRPAVSEDTSSVDSDDSIELEIRKFLAEKARESATSVCETPAPAGGPLALGTGTPALQPGVCTRSQRARGTPGSASLFAQGGKGAPLAELGPGLTAALAGCEPAAPRSASGVLSAKGSPGSRSGIYVHKDQSPRGAEPAASDSAPGQLPKAGSEARGAGGTFHVSYGSRSLLTPSPGPQADLPLPWSDFAHPARLPSPWALSSEGKGSAWTVGLGGEKEKGAEGLARGPLGLTLDPRKGPPFSGFSPLLSTQLFHFGRGVSWGSKHPGLSSAHLGLPLQSPHFSAFREPPASHGPVFGGSHLLGKEAGPWPGRKAQAGLSSQDRRGSGSGSGGPCADLRYRPGSGNTDPQDPEALGSDASELSDASVEDGVGARP